MISEFNIEAIINAIKSVVQSNREVPLHEPGFNGSEWEYVKDCLDSGWVSSSGEYVYRLEKMIADFTGAKHAVATVNGTSALHIALLLAGVGKKDEVFVPALTFVATANAVAYCGAIPHFVDGEKRTLGIDPLRLRDYLKEIAVVKSGSCINRRTGRCIRAIVPMHTFGHPVDMDPLLELAEEFQLIVVEDAAESLGSYYKGRHTGTMGLFGTLSFNGNKIATTGGGGAIITSNSDLARQAKHLTTQAKLPHPWSFFHDQIGYNYRMPNINAALGCAQLEQLPGFIARKRRLASRYEKAFNSLPGVGFFKENDFAKSNYWLNAVLLDEKYSDKRDLVLTAAHKAALICRPAWTPLHLLPMYEECPRMPLIMAPDIERRLINLPSSPNLESDV